MKIIVTGSEGLLGKEICKFLKDQKHSILKLDLILGHDLTDEKLVKSWFKKNKGDCIVNCFALNDHVSKNQKRNTLFDISLSSFNDYMKINLTTLFSVCREFARNKKSIGIVNFSSTYGLVSPKPSLYKGFHKDIGYGVSKAGVLNLSKYLAVHLAPKIRVNSIVPGGIKLSQDKKFIKNYSELTPMNRMMNKTELNGLVDFLCSKKSSYVTGSTIIADGGYTAW